MAKTSFRLEAIQPKPGSGNARAVYNKEIRAILNKVAGYVKRDFEDTVKTWTKKPTFRVEVEKSRSRLGISASTDNEIYGYVNYGTKAHIIRPKKAKALRFQTGYVAKTKPGRIVSRGGGASGSFVTAQEVHHPGTKPRRWDQLIARRRQKTIETDLNRAIAKANDQVNRNRAKGK